ncbi:unnamed protein product [marine sediment metagenome]|uniref:Uncharacterized protein n=1 Tax=marine sediment metagenome TaxID=412755 RepID=X1TPR0_9ZZZZ
MDKNQFNGYLESRYRKETDWYDKKGHSESQNVSNLSMDGNNLVCIYPGPHSHW